MKKLFALLMALAMVLSLAACGGSSSSSGGGGGPRGPQGAASGLYPAKAGGAAGASVP